MTHTPNQAPRIAIVTGGSRGLGRSTALALAARGVDVILTYHSNQSQAQSAVEAIRGQGRKALALALDTGNVASMDGFVQSVGQALREHWQCEQFRYLVNNAGTGVHAAFADTTEAQFDALMAVHFKGVFFLTQKLLPLLADGGRIVNLSSGLARFSLPGYAAYASMKGGIEVLTRYLAKELGPRGIAVNAIAPGAIETDFAGGVVRDNAEVNRQIAATTAMGRVGLPEDIGPMIAAFLGDENRWVTGQRIEVSGGTLL